MAFETYKSADIMAALPDYGDDILAYGYFTSDDPEAALLVANSTLAYKMRTNMYEGFQRRT